MFRLPKLEHGYPWAMERHGENCQIFFDLWSHVPAGFNEASTKSNSLLAYFTITVTIAINCVETNKKWITPHQHVSFSPCFGPRQPFMLVLHDFIYKQEYIPVGCVPPAR